MKTYVKRTLYLGLALMFVLTSGVFIYSYIRFNYYTMDDSKLKIDQAALQYFQESYEKCRQAFRVQTEALSKDRDGVEIFNIPVKGRHETDLNIDGCYLPASKKKRKLLIMTSGVHGVEGFVGSAVQCMFIAEFLRT
jgi:hypothetical protein